MGKVKNIKEKSKPLPRAIAPMLATLTKAPFNNEEYIYEVKWDGYRILAYVDGVSVQLVTREQQYYTEKYKAVANQLSKLGRRAVFDGEVVVLDKDGHPSFSLLQKYGRTKNPIQYYIFDLLWLDGKDLMGLPLVERKALLKEVLPADNEILRYSVEFNNGIGLYEQMQLMDMEGIVAKRKDSTYIPGARSKSWLKVPIHQYKEYVIGGWAESTSGRSYATLLLENTGMAS